MQRKMLIAVGSGGVSALASIAVIGGAPGGLLLVYVASLPLFLVGLSSGPVAAGIASISGILLSGTVGGLFAAGSFALAHGLPAWMVNRQALRVRSSNGTDTWYPLGNIAASLTVFGGIALVVVGGYLGNGHPGGLEAMVADHLKMTFDMALPNITTDLRGVLVDRIKPLFPGAMVASWIAMIAVNGLLAQRILIKAGSNLRPSGRIGDFDLPNWASWPLIAAAVIALVAPDHAAYVARNAAIVLALPFFLMGLVVVHGATRRLPARPVVLMAFYLTLLISTWALVIVAALGMLEQWAELRLRFTGSTDDES